MPDQDQNNTILPDRPRVAVLGLGQMGLVSAAMLADAGFATVSMWGHTQAESDELIQTRRSDRLADFVLPDAVSVSNDPGRALDCADLIVSAIPVQATRGAWSSIRGAVPDGSAVVSVAKGIENGTLMRPTQIIADAIADNPDAPARPSACLSGPTIAAELARGLPATMIAAADTEGLAEDLQRIFSTSYMRVYTHDDLLGVELAGAIKNVIAIAAGILDGLQAGSNAKSALLARGLAEIARLGAAMGASPSTFFGIAGVGDLATTCFSPEGRNRQCGEALGKGISLEQHLKDTGHVVEGIATTKSVADLAQRYRVDLPIASAVHAVLFDGLDPIRAISELMSRDLKDETVG
ncbi:MAG: NAD(P)H-dependent glycerol-3-phosphate dehydrogenase [Planctomycetota bacterium]